MGLLRKLISLGLREIMSFFGIDSKLNDSGRQKM